MMRTPPSRLSSALPLRSLAAGAVAALLLAGCTTTGGSTAPAGLSALSAADISGAALAGELRCGFADADGALYLLAGGTVASANPADGIVKASDAVIHVSAPGGFDAIINGGVFSASLGIAAVSVTGPANGGGESPPRPATLTYTPATGGSSQVIAGEWTCGP